MFMLKQSTFVVMMAAASLCAADVPAPANPEVTGYQRRGFRYELKVDVPLVDVDGNHIDKENLSYRLYVDGKPFTFTTAEYGYIDDVIEPRNTRFRIIRALQQLATKRVQNPAKKHGNIPL